MGDDRSFWQDRPTFLTGGAGLLGGWTVRRLVDLGAEVVCLVRDRVPRSILLGSDLVDRVNLVHGDVNHQGLLERALGEYEIDTILHLAAQTVVVVANRNPVSTFQSNVGGTWSLLEAARRSPAVRSVVVASTDKVYGDQGEGVYDEDSPLLARFPYDVSKSCADAIARCYADTYRLPVAITRCGNLFGGGDLNWSRLVPGTIRAALRGQRPLIRSNGSPVRDYFYVEDAAEAYLLLARSLHERPDEIVGQAFNFSNEGKNTVLEVVTLILGLLGSDLQPEILATATNEIPHQQLSARKAHDTLGWRPRFDLEGGLVQTISWYRKFWDAMR